MTGVFRPMVRPLIVVGAASMVLVSLSQLSADDVVPSGGPLPPEADPVVRQLIDRLDSHNLAERVQAEQSLRELGPSILPELARDEALQSVRIRDAVERIRRDLEKIGAEQSLRPSRITLVGRHSLAEIVAELEHQTGNRLGIVGADADAAVIEVDLHSRTFWEAVTRLSREHGLSLTYPADGGPPLLGQREASADVALEMLPVESFRICVSDVRSRSDLTDDTRQIVRVGMTLEFEPRLNPLFVRADDASFVVNGTDAVFKPLNPRARREYAVAQGHPVALSVDLVTSKCDSVARVDVTGALEVELAARRERLVFEDPLNRWPVARHHGGVEVSLDAFEVEQSTAGGRVGRVRMTTLYDDQGPEFDSHRSWVLHNDVILEGDDKARPWAPTGSQILSQRGAGVVLEYRFENLPDAGEIDRLVTWVPVQFLAVPLIFEFHDLPVGASDLGGAQMP